MSEVGEDLWGGILLILGTETAFEKTHTQDNKTANSGEGTDSDC